MDILDYVIDPTTFNLRKALADWRDLLPESFKVVMVNLFGDMFLESADGAIDMIDTAGCKLKHVAESREEFFVKLKEEKTARWLHVALVDELQRREMLLEVEKCYSWKLPPRLGGEYDADNVEIADIYESLSMAGQIAVQTKDLPPGTKVNVKMEPEA